VTATLYALKLSHPCHAAELMLDHKGIEHETVYLIHGLHPAALEEAGFPGRTVPALKLDGRTIQGSREISTALEELQPRPPLYPSDADARRAVEEAERWGEAVLQELVRRVFRWAVAEQPVVRRWLAVDVIGVPAAEYDDSATESLARRFARDADATDERVRRDLEEVPAVLDHTDALIDRGVIGDRTPNAADFQIAPSVRVLLAISALRPAIERRPCGELAERLVPGLDLIPAEIPSAWVARLEAGS
jgi:glutathione S-transferase